MFPMILLPVRALVRHFKYPGKFHRFGFDIEKDSESIGWSRRFGNSIYEIIIGIIFICVALTIVDIRVMPSFVVVTMVVLGTLVYLKVQDSLFTTWLNYNFELLVSEEEFKQSKLEIAIILVLGWVIYYFFMFLYLENSLY